MIGALGVTTVTNKGPKLYATFLLWMLSELFENLPKVGDSEKPKFVLFFDEAHLTFDDAADALLDKIEQMVRLISSKSCRHLFCQPESGGYSRRCAGSIGDENTASLARIHPQRKESS